MSHPRVLIGVDVGGTFTNAVAIADGRVLATSKAPTRQDELDKSLLSALDGVLDRIVAKDVARVCLSTTLITNLIASRQLPPVALLLIPGPGIDPELYTLPGQAWCVAGAADFRGREITPLDRRAVNTALDAIDAAGYRHLAIVGKFSPRYPAHEDRAAEIAHERQSDWRIVVGHSVTGQLSFPRRIVATALQSTITEPYGTFLDRMKAGLAQRGLACPTTVLKGDGGTLALEAARAHPLESLASGPAASAMGALALRPRGATSVVVDIGGSTTDLGLILDGQPLFSSAGATLDGMRLPIRAFATRSLPLGGDSPLTLDSGEVRIGASRAGVAACLGGPAPTLTDALRVAGWTGIGDEPKAIAALARLGVAGDIAEAAIELALRQLEESIRGMLVAWQQEPVYRLWELRQKGERRPDVVVGLGGAAQALMPALGKRLEAGVIVPPQAEYANALGAALARTTHTTTLHADTQQGALQLVEEGRIVPLPAACNTLQGVRQAARGWMERQGQALGIDTPLTDAIEVLAEQFNIIEGWETVGKLFDVCLERPCGLIEAWEPGSETCQREEAER